MRQSVHRSVLVLGTDHRFQRRDPELTESQHQKFAAFIKATAMANVVAALVEENNPEAVAEADIEESTIQAVARNLGLKHLHCDPNRKTRAELSIFQENEVLITAFFDNATDLEIQRRINESMRARERYWLAQLQQFDTWPILFICGANHALPFLNLLGEANVDAILVAEDWGT